MNDKTAEPSARKKQVDERKARLASIMQSTQTARVRVNPASDAIRKHIVHPSGKIKFPESGSVEWPNDQFTKRRVREGAVTLEETGKAAPKPTPPPKPAT